jgi:hypothetical protein
MKPVLSAIERDVVWPDVHRATPFNLDIVRELGSPLWA